MNPSNEKGRVDGPSPHSPDADETSLAHKDFGKLPCAVARALVRGELDYHEHSILTFYIGALDWRTGEYVTTLSGIVDAIKWPHREDYLYKIVKDVAEKGWIDVKTRSGPRAPWIITHGPRLIAALTQGAVGEVVFGDWPSGYHLPDSDASTEIRTETSTEIPTEITTEIRTETISDQKPTPVRPSPESNGDSTTLNLGTSLSPIEEDVEEDVYKDSEEQAEPVNHSGEGELEPSELAEEVSAVIERAKRLSEGRS